MASPVQTPESLHSGGSQEVRDINNSVSDSQEVTSIMADETVEADMTQTGLEASISQDGQEESDTSDNNQQHTFNTPKVIDISCHCPEGVRPLTTFQRALRDTMLEGEFMGELVILVVGRTGEGKSTLINSIIELNKQIAKEEAGRNPCTKSLESYIYTDLIPDITITLVDTPGLQDTHRKEQTHIQLIKEQCSQVNLILYCMKMTDQRMVNDDQIAMQKFHQAFGPKFWDRVVFVLTNSNKEDCELSDDRDKIVVEPPFKDLKAWEALKVSRFEGRFKKRKKDLRDFLKEEVLEESDVAIADRIQCVFAGHYKCIPSQPDPYQLHGSENWLYDLAKQCCEEIKVKHTFLKLTLNNRINFAIIIDNSTENKDIESLNDQAKSTKEALENLGFCVLYFNCLSSHCFRLILRAFQEVDHSQLSIIALVVLSKGNTRHVHGTDNEVITFEELFSHFNHNIISRIPKFFFFHLTHDDTSNQLDFNVNIPKNSIALVASFFHDKNEKSYPGITSFIANVTYGSRKLSQCFKKIEDQCSKLPEAQCSCQSTLNDNFVLPFPRDNCEDASFTEKEIDVCRTMWYQIRCETIEVILKNKKEIINIVFNERLFKIFSSVVSITGGALAVAGLIWAPFTFGASLSLSFAGGVVTCVGAASGIAAQINSLVNSNYHLRTAQEHVKMDQQLSVTLNAIGAKYNKVIQAQKKTIFVNGIKATAGAVGTARFGFLLIKSAIQEGGEVAAETAGRFVGGAVAAVTIPIDVGFIIYNVYQIYKASQDKSGSTDSNKAINEFVKQIESSMKGFLTVIDERKYKYNDILALNDKECGYTVNVPQSINPRPTVTVSTIVSGPFAFPEGTTLVSAIYDVQIDTNLKDSITLDIEHCVDKFDPLKMTFAIGSVKIDHKLFKFDCLDGGVFPNDQEHGSIKLTKSCLLCILYRDTKSLQVKYAAQSSYKPLNQNVWKFRCSFTKCLNAHVKFARQFGDTEVYTFKFTKDSTPYMDLDVLRCETKTREEWSISPCTVSANIQKAELDVLEYVRSHKLLQQIIPFFELDIVRPPSTADKAISDELKYTFQFSGTNLKLFIACKK